MLGTSLIMDHETLHDKILEVLANCDDFVNHDRLMSLGEFPLDHERAVIAALGELERWGTVVVAKGKKGKMYRLAPPGEE